MTNTPFPHVSVPLCCADVQPPLNIVHIFSLFSIAHQVVSEVFLSKRFLSITAALLNVAFRLFPATFRLMKGNAPLTVFFFRPGCGLLMSFLHLKAPSYRPTVLPQFSIAPSNSCPPCEGFMLTRPFVYGLILMYPAHGSHRFRLAAAVS